MKSASCVKPRRCNGTSSVYLTRDSVVSGMPAFFKKSTCSGASAVMAYSISPPSRTSSRRTFTEKPSGPHHDSMPSFVVQSSQTSSTVPLKVRSRLTRRRAGWICEGKLGTAPIRLLQHGEVELAHLQQGFHDFCRVPRFRVSHHLPQSRGDDLPRHAESVLQPAARSFLSPVGQARPDLVDLFLGFAGRDKREGFRERKRRSAVESLVFLSVELEAGVQHTPFRKRTIRLGAQQAEDLGIRKQRNVEIDRLFGAGLERQTRSHALNLDLIGDRRRPRTYLRHVRSSLCLARVLPRRSSSAANLSRRASHMAR